MDRRGEREARTMKNTCKHGSEEDEWIALKHKIFPEEKKQRCPTLQAKPME
jgi:hypothetical protein